MADQEEQKERKSFKWAKSAATPAPTGNPFSEAYEPESAFAPSGDTHAHKPLPPVPPSKVAKNGTPAEAKGGEGSDYPPGFNPFHDGDSAAMDDFGMEPPETNERKVGAPKPAVAQKSSGVDAGRLENDSLRSQVRALAGERSSLLSEIQGLRGRDVMAVDPRRVFELLRDGSPSCLAALRSLESKTKLMDRAEEEVGDTSTQLAVLQFVRSTLSEDSVFLPLLPGRPRLMAVWEAHLRACVASTGSSLSHVGTGAYSPLRQLIVFLRHIGRHREVSLLRLREAYRHRQGEARARAMEDTVRELTANPPPGHDLLGPATEQAQLLRRQLLIEQHDAKVAASGKEEIYIRYPRRCIVFAPLAFTLHYALTYHPFASKEKNSSPVGMRTAFDVSDRLYEYVCLKARAKVGDIDAVRQLPKKKGMLSSKKKSLVGFDVYVEVLAQARAPRQVLIEFCGMITDPVLRFGVAMRHHLYDHAVDACRELKDQVKLIELRNHILATYGPERTEEIRNRIVEIVRDPKINWKRLVSPDDI